MIETTFFYLLKYVKLKLWNAQHIKTRDSIIYQTFQILSNSADFNNLSTKENPWKRKEKIIFIKGFDSDNISKVQVNPEKEGYSYTYPSQIPNSKQLGFSSSTYIFS